MISRFVSSSLLIVLAPLTLFAAEKGSQLDVPEPLFTVMAAANAAGYNAGLETSPKLRTQVRDAIAATNAPVLAELKSWYHEHPAPDKTQDLSRLISLGISVSGPPDFAWAKREVEVPPDAMEMDEFRKMLPRFYEQAKIAQLWSQSQRAADALLEGYQEPITKAIFEVNGYVRRNSNDMLNRHFQVDFDLLGAPNQVQIRNYVDDFFVVLTPSSDRHMSEIRHAYFRFVIDPLAFKYGEELKKKSSLMDIAEAAPLLGDQYKSDFGLFATECLIRAIESRLNSNPSMIDQAVREGFILTPFFNEQLALYEKQPASMKIYFPEMVAALNVRHEITRLQNVQFATQRAEAPVKKVEVQPAFSSEAMKTIAQADEAYYDKRDMGSAQKLYQQALEQQGSATDHARAYYGLAHIAMIQKDPETADQLFRKTLQSSADPDTQAWSCYYLGRLAKLTDEPTEAAKWFNQALAIKDATPAVMDKIRQDIANAGTPDKE